MGASNIPSLVASSTAFGAALSAYTDNLPTVCGEVESGNSLAFAAVDNYIERAGDAIFANLPPCRLERTLSALFRGDPDALMGLTQIDRDFLAGRWSGIAQFYRTARFARDPRIREKAIDMIGTRYCEEGSLHALRLLTRLAQLDESSVNIYYWLAQAHVHYGRQDALPALTQAAVQSLRALVGLKVMADCGENAARSAMANLDVSAHGSAAAHGNQEAARALVYLHKAGNCAARGALRIAAETYSFAGSMLAMIEDENSPAY